MPTVDDEIGGHYVAIFYMGGNSSYYCLFILLFFSEVQRGDIVIGHYRENDWIYISKQNGVEGFIPAAYCTFYMTNGLNESLEKSNVKNLTAELPAEKQSALPLKTVSFVANNRRRSSGRSFSSLLRVRVILCKQRNKH